MTTLARGGLLSAVAVLALVAAPTAAADENGYLREIRGKVEAPLTDPEALQLGHTACTAIRDAVSRGVSLGQARHAADQAVGHAAHELNGDFGLGPGFGLTMPDGMFLVEAAEHQLC
ncbi:hypothetical protein [Mycolicibacterium lutetiense]